MSELEELPNGWAWTTLRECSSSPEKIVPKSLDREDFVYVDISSIDADSASVASAHRISTSAAPSRARQQLRSGDTLFSTVRPNLRRIAYIGDKLDGEIGSTGFLVLRPSEALIPRFLFHFVRTESFIDVVCAKARGVSYPAVRPADILDQRIPLPPLAEQHRIVEALEDQLSRLDAAEKTLVSAKARVRTLDSRMLDDVIGANPHSNAIPDEWKWKFLAQISGRSGYGTSTKCDPGANGSPVLRIPNIQNGNVELDPLKFAVDETLDLSKFFVNPGDLLFVRTNGSPSLIGRSAVVSQAQDVAFASYLIRFPMGDIELAKWIHNVTRSPRWRRLIVDAAASSAGQYNLNSKFLGSIRIPLPPESVILELNSAIIAGNESTNRLISSLESALQRAHRLRLQLLASAFAGTLVDQDPAEEPASILLERIAAERDNAKPAVRRRTSVKAKV